MQMPALPSQESLSWGLGHLSITCEHCLGPWWSLLGNRTYHAHLPCLPQVDATSLAGGP